MKPKNNLISVIIPTYNRVKILPRAINSVINQTYKNWELTIVDDRSMDNTKELIKKYMKKDKRVKYILNTHKQGPGGARNQGIEVAKGKYIAFLDSDDEWNKKHLERNINFFLKYDIDFIFSDRSKLNDNNQLLFKSLFQKCNLLSNCKYKLLDKSNHFYQILDNRNLMKKFFLKGFGVISTPTIVYKKDSIKILYKNYKNSQDLLFYLENIMNGVKFGFINEVNCKCFETKGSLFNPYTSGGKKCKYENECMSRSFFYNQYKNDLNFIEKFYLREQISNQLNILGNYFRDMKDFNKALEYYYKSIKIWPLILFKKKCKINFKIMKIYFNKINNLFKKIIKNLENKNNFC